MADQDSPQEVAAKLREIMKRASPIELGSFWHTCGSKAAIMGFMRQEGIPPFLWHLLFRRQRTAYRRHMVSHIESLHRGAPVVTLRKREFRIVLAGGKAAAGASPPPSPPQSARERAHSEAAVKLRLSEA